MADPAHKTVPPQGTSALTVPSAVAAQLAPSAGTTQQASQRVVPRASRLLNPACGPRPRSCKQWNPHVPLRIFSISGERGRLGRQEDSLAPGVELFRLPSRSPTGKGAWRASLHRMILQAPWMVPPRLERMPPALRFQFHSVVMHSVCGRPGMTWCGLALGKQCLWLWTSLLAEHDARGP